MSQPSLNLAIQQNSRLQKAISSILAILKTRLNSMMIEASQGQHRSVDFLFLSAIAIKFLPFLGYTRSVGSWLVVVVL
jgi:uncharacterized membrane protein YqjE